MTVSADVRTFIAENDLTARSPWRAIGRTATVVTLYAALTLVGFVLDRPLFWITVWLAQGFVLVGSYSAMHEAAHGLLYRSRRSNRAVGPSWGSTILVNYSLWRTFHLEHHARTGTAEDPENRYKVDIVRRSQYLLLPLGGLQFLGQLWWESLGTLFGRYPSYVRQGADKRAIRIDALMLLGVTALACIGVLLAPMLTLRVWGAAFLVTACVLLPGTAINEHYGCDTEGEAFDTTRTVVSNRLLRFLVWNSNFHAGHHLVASVPFHKAAVLHEYIAPRTRYLARSYTAFHLEVLRSCGRGSSAGAEGGLHDRFGGGLELSRGSHRSHPRDAPLGAVAPARERRDDHVVITEAHRGDIADGEAGEPGVQLGDGVQGSHGCQAPLTG